MAHPPLTEIPDTDHGHFRFTPLFEPRGASRRQPRTAGTARRTILASQPCWWRKFHRRHLGAVRIADL